MKHYNNRNRSHGNSKTRYPYYHIPPIVRLLEPDFKIVIIWETDKKSKYESTR